MCRKVEILSYNWEKLYRSSSRYYMGLEPKNITFTAESYWLRAEPADQYGTEQLRVYPLSWSPTKWSVLE